MSRKVSYLSCRYYVLGPILSLLNFRTENSRLFVSEVYCSLIRLNSQCLFMQCNVGTVFSHELCTFPPRLFATEELLLSADTKSELAKSIPSLEDPASSIRDDMKYVIDGGMLIHRITWKVDLHSQIFVRAMFLFCRNICNVCDGYRNPTKDMAHKVRSKNLSCSISQSNYQHV